jgi:hypothetical protein
MFRSVSGRTGFNVTLVTLVCLAAASAGVLAYGTDPYWGQFHKGLGLIVFTQRLQWVLATVSLLCCLAVVTLIVVGGRRVFWLIALGPVLALFAHRILSNPMRLYSIVDNPVCVKADVAGQFLRDGDYIVGVELAGEAWAYPYAALYTAPVVLQTSHDQRLMLIWSAYANRAVAYKIDFEVRYKELSIASMPANALLVYNARAGQFINGVTGLTTHGERPNGCHTALPVYKVTWGQWKTLHPETMVMPPRDGRHEPAGPIRPRYEMPAEAPRHAATRPSTEEVIFAATTRPVAVPEDAVTANAPANVAAGETQLLLLRDTKTGLLRAFDRHVDGDLAPFFHQKVDAKHSAVKLEDNDSGSEWSDDGKCVEGPFKGKALAPVAVDDGVYWGVMRYWFPDAVWTTPRQPSGPPPVFSNPPEKPKRPRTRRR